MRAVAYFLRHGETTLNKEHAFDGPMDPDLNADGHRQADEIASFFKGQSFSAAFHSTKKRTKQTIEPLMKSKGMESKLLVGLDPLDTGDFAGTPKTEKSMKEMKWYRKHPFETIPGGEKVREFRKKADSAIMSVIKRGESSNRPTVACVHGSVIREISRLLHKDYNKARVDPGGIVGIYEGPHGYDARPLLKEDKKPAEEIPAGS